MTLAPNWKRAVEANRKLIIQFIAAYNRFDIEGMTALLTPDVRFENYSGDTLTAQTTGLEEFRALAEQSKAMFSEREQRITSLNFHGDTVTVAIDYRGRLTNDLPNGMKAGSLLELNGSSEYTIEGGKISRLIDRS